MYVCINIYSFLLLPLLPAKSTYYDMYPQFLVVLSTDTHYIKLALHIMFKLLSIMVYIKSG